MTKTKFLKIKLVFIRIDESPFPKIQLILVHAKLIRNANTKSINQKTEISKFI